ncbi:cytochrome P450, partial [Suillus americanus]
MLSAHILALGISCIIALAVALGLTRRRVYPLPLPPGPRKIIHSRILEIDLIIINSETVARDLLDKRSANYSTRPVIRTNELAGLAFNTVFLPYGETLRRHRKIFHQVLRAEVSVSYHKMYSRHANDLVINLLNATSDPQQQIEVYTASLIMAVTYGHLAHGHEDPFLTRARQLLHIGEQMISPDKAAMFTAFPFLEKLPSWCFGGAHAQMGRSRELAQQLLNEPFDEVKAQIADGTASHSLVADFLSQSHDDTEEDTMKGVASRDTQTATTLQIFLLAMVLYPDVQARARAEIDQVVRHDKMPCPDDRESLPYLDAILFEVLRWYPVGPLGIPHATSDDDVYDGYFIPKGSKALSRDEDMFPNASRFDPSRHLTVDGKLKDTFVNHFAFGRWFAENSLWTAVSAILAVLRIDHAKDSNGDSTGLVIHPEPFYCSFESVNTAREGHLREMMNSKYICKTTEMNA